MNSGSSHQSTVRLSEPFLGYWVWFSVFFCSCIYHVYIEIVQGPVHAYVAVPGGKTCYLSELKAGKEVIVVDQKGQQRTAIVGRVKIRPLILVEAKVEV
jgi:hypothetical protein